MIEWASEPYEPPSEPVEDEELYEEPCMECGGKVVATGGQHWYNGTYDCYTLYLNCENCGPYEVECV
jgi:hypothetical protein